MHDTIQLIGWVGTVTLIAVYGLTTYGKLTESGSTHLAINVLAPVAILVSTAALHEWPLTTINAVRLTIGFVPLARWLRERRASAQRVSQVSQ